MTDSADRSRDLIFLCVANAARSQMAEGLARASAPADWRIHSAGSAPGLLHPLAIEAMREIDIDISRQRSKGMDDVPLDRADVLVTLCAEEVCPIVPPKVERLHWPFPDPANQGDMIRHQLDAFREVRDGIRERIDAFWREHASAGTHP